MPFPQKIEELLAAGYSRAGSSACSCGSVIEWWITPSGKRMPMDKGVQGVMTPHWATCPKADKFRKAKK